MAGSWDHMTTSGGRFRNNETFCGMIENLGDAYEAAEECFGMVQWLANELAVSQPTRGSRTDWVRRARRHYQEGLRIGGRQRER